LYIIKGVGMRKFILIVTLLLVIGSSELFSQRIGGGDNFGFGIVLGEPTGLTLKWYVERDKALVFDLGASYFGSPRISADYIWHFDAFRSDVAKLYAGPGLVLGIGESRGFWYKEKGNVFVRGDNEIGIGARGIFGVNFIPRETPLEFFLELGVLLALAPDFGSGVDAAIGMRFYP
jgi:hypothetical protein